MTDTAEPVLRCPMALSRTRDGLGIADELARVRDSGELAQVTTAFGQEATLISRYAEVRAQLADTDGFFVGTVAPPPALTDAGFDPEKIRRRRKVGNLIFLDPPEHTRLRKMVHAWFTTRRVERLRPRVVEIINTALDAMEKAGPPVDLVTMFAKTVPVMVICELIGVPEADRERFRSKASRVEQDSSPLAELRRLGDAGWVTRELINHHRENPSDDIIGMLLREHGAGSEADDITDDELVGLANALLIAGHETTTQMLSLGTLALLRHPEQLAMMRDDPEVVPGAVEELLRYLGVLHGGFVRQATRDTVVGGHVFREGDLVVPALAAANRDPEYIADGDRLDITRAPSGHLAFGHGVHFCIGAPLARMELREAYPALLNRFPGLRLAIPESELQFSDDTTVYALKSLPVTW
ncbi:MAG: cytochrome P450 [Hamadaea sp.]|uniref:cytochrome P450 n=1 Tax=Hamadaea sp. TaxID=2024425 RepID=UPI00183B31A5|nr:cytochrome P450 [Hamadaea sp.]NUT23295.1 cytochrome P450 [Hamadaea sp.]